MTSKRSFWTVMVVGLLLAIGVVGLLFGLRSEDVTSTGAATMPAPPVSASAPRVAEDPAEPNETEDPGPEDAAPEDAGPVDPAPADLESDDLASSTLLPREEIDVEDKDAGLKEPSGLTLDRAGTTWMVSDKTTALFQLDRNGRVTRKIIVSDLGEGLEGISVGPDVLQNATATPTMFVVLEPGNVVAQVSATDGTVIARKRIDELANYESVAALIESGGSNKGFEGVSWDSDGDRLFVLKEGEPGVLLQLSTNLDQVVASQELTAAIGFIDDDTEGSTLDFSGLAWDSQRGLMWITSDQGRRVFAFDWDDRRVVADFALLDADGDEVKKSEGVAITPDSTTLAIVSESKAKLFTWDLAPAR